MLRTKSEAVSSFLHGVSRSKAPDVPIYQAYCSVNSAISAYMVKLIVPYQVDRLLHPAQGLQLAICFVECKQTLRENILQITTIYL